MVKHYYNSQCMYICFYDLQLEVLQLKVLCMCLDNCNFEIMYEALQLQLWYVCTFANIRDVGCYSNAVASNFTSCKALQEQLLYACTVAAKRCSSKQLLAAKNYSCRIDSCVWLLDIAAAIVVCMFGSLKAIMYYRSNHCVHV